MSDGIYVFASYNQGTETLSPSNSQTASPGLKNKHLSHASDKRLLQPADIGWPTGNGKKLSCSQACCLAQLCLAAP